MPDLGGIGRGLLKKVRDRDEKDEKDEAPAAPDTEVALADEPEEHADSSEVRELAELLQQLLETRRPPAGPIMAPWSFGFGDLLGEHPKVPKKVRGLVKSLNRFGGIELTPEEITFDGDDVAWEKVTEVRTRHVVDYLVGDAVQEQVESLPVPWFPGRKRLLDSLGRAVLTVTIATAEKHLESLDFDLRVPAEVHYKGAFGKKKELGAGVLGALVLADPAVNTAVVATAQAKGIPVRAAGDENMVDAGERAAQLRAKIAALEVELDKFTRRFGSKKR